MKIYSPAGNKFMMIKKFYIVLFLTFSLPFFGQESTLKISDFDNAYLQEIKLENSELSARIKTFPKEIQDLNKEVSAAIRNNNDSKALEIALQMDKLYPNNPDIKNFIGKRKAKASDFPTAIKYFEEALKLNEKNKWFYVNKASVLAETNQIEEALNTAEKLISLFPNWSIGYNLKAAFLTDLNQQNEALKAYELAIMAEPKSAQILTNRGDLYVQISKENEAIADYKKALELQPDYARAKEKLSIITKNSLQKK